jgi:hypothetical protein
MTKDHGSLAGITTAASERIELKGPQPIVDVFEIEFLGGGVGIFAFMYSAEAIHDYS